MESSTSNQPKLPLPRGDLATTPTTLRASVYRSSLSPDDGYDYKDTEPSPEGSATQEQDNVNSSKIYSQSSAVSNTTINHENHQDDNIPDYRRPAEGWRAKVLDEEDAPNGVFDPVNIFISHEAVANARLRYVLLQWKKEELDGAEKLVLNALSPGNNAKLESPNHVIWQHSELEDVELGGFEVSLQYENGQKPS